MAPPTLEASAITQGYGRRRVLAGVTLTVGGGCVAILGPNAAGKTTLLRTLATAVRPISGELRILGKATTDSASLRAIRRSLGFVPQHATYPAGFTVSEFLSYAAWLREVPDQEIPAAVEVVLDGCDLQGFRDSKLRRLSGGTSRRVALAQALVHRPAVLLLDEPVAALDLAQRKRFYQLLDDARGGTTVVLTTHLVDEVTDFCDRIVVMADGRLIDEMNTADIRREAGGPAEARAAVELRYLAATGRTGD
jgi:ABC-2 type transport system ATP-binding protein